VWDLNGITRTTGSILASTVRKVIPRGMAREAQAGESAE